jgi:hypothetical protein
MKKPVILKEPVRLTSGHTLFGIPIGGVGSRQTGTDNQAEQGDRIAATSDAHRA